MSDEIQLINLLKRDFMPTYYTEYPTGWFNVSGDEEALLHEPDAKVIYKQSDTPDGRPFIIIRDTHVKKDS